MKLKVTRPYRNAIDAWDEGAVIEVDEEKGLWLQRDSPGTFELVKPKQTRKPRTKAMKAPANTAITADDVTDK